MIISGNVVAETIKNEIRSHILKRDRKPTLAVILVGDNPASLSYVGAKSKACNSVGIQTVDLKFPKHFSQEALLACIEQQNRDPQVDGILMQVPLPSHIDENVIVEAILPEKDIDGFHPQNLGKLLLGLDSGFIPCTPLGIKMLLEDLLYRLKESMW